MGEGLRVLNVKPTAESLVFLATRPLDPKVVGDLPVAHPEPPRFVHGDLVGLDLRRSVDVAVPSIPELLPIVPLADVRELVQDVQVQDPLLALPEVAETG